MMRCSVDSMMIPSDHRVRRGARSNTRYAFGLSPRVLMKLYSVGRETLREPLGRLSFLPDDRALGSPLRVRSEIRFGARGRTRRFHSCRTSKRIRHHSECGWNQTQTDRSATVTGASDAGDYAGKCRSRSSVVGRSVGATESAEPIFHPSNGGAAHMTPVLEDTVRFRIVDVNHRG